jgi:hypothetical protein
MRRTLSGWAVGCLLAALAPAVVAQQAQPSPRPPAQAEPRSAQAGEQPSVESARPNDLSITARVTAESLVFRRVPTPRVEFTGHPRRETSWEADRTNLPEQVQPGVTYRDIGITLRITSIFPDIERIVAEALGEVAREIDSVTDDPAPQTPTRIETPAATVAPARTGARARRPSAQREGREQ